MEAVVIEEFGVRPRLKTVPDPQVPDDGVVVAVEATGVCRSDWHTWQGHDPDVGLPHVAGHELAGRIEAVGPLVRDWAPGARVTVPFVCACGTCAQCARGAQQICDRQFQPGATAWGSFAERVALPRADANLVALPNSLDATAAAALGCRFATAYRAVVGQGRVQPAQWVAVFGCGGVGLSAVQLAVAAGADVVAVDVSEAALDLAAALGATVCVRATVGGSADDLAGRIRAVTGGAHASLDCLGSPLTCAASVASLRKHGRHVQVGLMPPAQGAATVPMDLVVARELELVGVHGLAAHEYPALLRLVESAGIDLGRMVGARVALASVPDVLEAMSAPAVAGAGVTVVELA